MFDMGFLPDIRRILRSLPTNRQTLLFSATMPPDIRSLATEALRNPATIQIGQIAPAETVTHALYPVPLHLKLSLMLDLLPPAGSGSVLIFTGTKHRAKRIGEKLSQLGYRATSLQGNLSQNRRQQALDGFRDGQYQIMVATDIAARGIDISLVKLVINFDMPTTAEAYTHRIGRTGRAERTGEAISLVTHEDESMVRAIERLIGRTIERRTLAGFDYTMPATTPALPVVAHREAHQPLQRHGKRPNQPARNESVQRATNGKPAVAQPEQPGRPAPARPAQAAPRAAQPAAPLPAARATSPDRRNRRSS
jgi:ATP-dependent RNA helicase RhlE